jgi:hypothetical protein
MCMVLIAIMSIVMLCRSLIAVLNLNQVVTSRVFVAVVASIRNATVPKVNPKVNPRAHAVVNA